MSNINRNNYEAFLLDYVEQNLSPDLVAELMLFLEQNPDLKAELEAFENVTFTANPSTTFHEKQNLKQTAIETLMIAEIENLNTPQETKELFEEIAQNSSYEKLYHTYQKTILKPITIVFADKKSLKQKDTKVVPLYWWISSAAAILVMFLLLKNFNTNMVEPLLVESTKEENPPLTPPKEGNATNAKNFANFTTPKKSGQVMREKKNTTPTSEKQFVNNEKQATSNPKKSEQAEQPVTKNVATIEPSNKEYIEIEAYKEKEYITIEAFAENTEQPTTTKNDEYLTVSELLKQEAQKRLMENEVKTSSKELIAANMVAKVLGKNAEVETVENIQGETEEYALNIGEFSFSRKIRK